MKYHECLLARVLQDEALLQGRRAKWVQRALLTHVVTDVERAVKDGDRARLDQIHAQLKLLMVRLPNDPVFPVVDMMEYLELLDDFAEDPDPTHRRQALDRADVQEYRHGLVEVV